MTEQITIENQIKNVLSGDTFENALDFVDFLQANELTPVGHDGGDGWSVNYADESVGFILINGVEQEPGPWTVWFNSCDFGDCSPADDDLKETAWAHASICGHFSSGGKQCGCGNQPGFSRTIFGKVFENRCHSPLMFTNPDAKTLENIKKLMLMLKQNIIAMQHSK